MQAMKHTGKKRKKKREEKMKAGVTLKWAKSSFLQQEFLNDFFRFHCPKKEEKKTKTQNGKREKQNVKEKCEIFGDLASHAKNVNDFQGLSLLF